MQQRNLFQRFSGSLAATLLLGAFAYTFLYVPRTNALTLPSLDVSLPLKGGALSPITDQLNKVTNSLPVPINLNTKSNQLGVNVDTGLTLGGSQPLGVNVNVPLPDVVPDTVNTLTDPLTPVTQPVGNTLAPVTNAVTPVTNGISRPLASALAPIGNPARPTTPRPGNGNNQPSPAPTVTTGTSRPAGSSAILTVAQLNVPSSTSARLSSSNQQSTLAAIGGFLASIPTNVQSFASNLAGKNVNILPIAISTLILMLTVFLIAAIDYASTRGGILSFGNHQITVLSKIAGSGHIAMFVVVTLSLGIIMSFLALTGL